MNIDKNILAELKADQKPKRTKMSRNKVKKGLYAMSDAENAFFGAVSALSKLDSISGDLEEYAESLNPKVVRDFSQFMLLVRDMHDQSRKLARQAEDMRYDYNAFFEDFES